MAVNNAYYFITMWHSCPRALNYHCVFSLLQDSRMGILALCEVRKELFYYCGTEVDRIVGVQ